MNPDLETLLGAFATDTLTEEERKRLFTAALADQQLFNVLADEQALKELLADPEIRRRLLQSLRQSKPATSGVTASWFNWAVRPTTLAVAGGLGAAVLAVVLGIRIYQDSLRTTVRPPVTEDAPSAPAQTPLAAQPKPAESSDAPASPQPRHPSQKSATSSVEQTQAERHKKEAVPSSREDRAQVPPAPAQAPVMPAPAPGAISAAPQAGARALFYAGEQRKPQAERAAKSDQANPKAAAPSRDRLRSQQKAMRQQEHRTLESIAPSGPLGLRYSFVLHGTDGSPQEVEAATALHSLGPVSLTVETNQDAYLQIWKIEPSSAPDLLFPEKQTDQVSFKITAGHRHIIPLSAETRAVSLAARLSRAPLGALGEQEAFLHTRTAPDQVQESIASREHATYVVSRDLAQHAQMWVSVLPGR
jgi:hypothetical protein